MTIFLDDGKIRILNNRYIVCQGDRWDFRYNTFKDYLIKNGLRGCFLSAEDLYIKNKTKEEIKRIRDWRGLNSIDIWDLSLIFKGVDFLDNYQNINSEIERILN